MKVVISNDHRGFKAIEQIKAVIQQLGFECIDCSVEDEQSVDYPDMAYRASQLVSEKAADRAILVCGTGIGMSIAANKIKGIRAALCFDELSAKLSREHNDANVLCLSGDMIGSSSLRKIVETWLTTEFVGGRHLRRVKKIGAIESGTDPREVTTES